MEAFKRSRKCSVVSEVFSCLNEDPGSFRASRCAWRFSGVFGGFSVALTGISALFDGFGSFRWFPTVFGSFCCFNQMSHVFLRISEVSKHRAKEAPPNTHWEIRGSAGAPGRVRACPGVSGRGRCPGVSGRQKNNAGIASWVSGRLSTATPCPGASGRFQRKPRRVRARGARAPAARGIP